jgi:hypothetical protein
VRRASGEKPLTNSVTLDIIFDKAARRSSSCPCVSIRFTSRMSSCTARRMPSCESLSNGAGDPVRERARLSERLGGIRVVGGGIVAAKCIMKGYND